METKAFARTLFACALLLAGISDSTGQSLQLGIQPSGAELELSWPGSLLLPSGRTVYPLFQVEESVDLRAWQSSGPLLKGTRDLMTTFVAPSQTRSFYRLNAQWQNTSANPTDAGGAKVFGYEETFETELQRIGQISAQEFRSRYAVTNSYLGAITWDPTTATYWNRFATDPAVNNVGLSPTNKGYRYYDFRLNTAEQALLRQNGFVVSERLGTTNFAELFYRLWNDDLPVFVSADAMLQAWHRSYANMLIELEHFWLHTIVGEILDGMAAEIRAAELEAMGGPLEVSVLDADYFLTVARSLYAGSRVASTLGQDARVQRTLDAINREQLECLTLFDYPRWIDFSQFKVRGHYTDSERLSRYFKTVMWLGRTDLRVAGGDQDCDGNELPSSRRQLGIAIVLGRLLELADQFENWQRFDQAIRTFVGLTDSMTFAQLADLTAAAGIRTLSDVSSAQQLAELQTEIERGTLGLQNIRGEVLITPFGPAKVRLPRSFTVFGQTFVLDSWALTKVVFDNILWIQNGETNDVLRRVPSSLDIAFGVLGNGQIVPELVERMTNTAARMSTNHSVRWRDGFPYQHNLAALRNVIESQEPSIWENNIYTSWLGMLRELSGATIHSQYPQAMRTRAWAMRTLNTQLASWSQLRHDTILYAKQSYTFPGLCEYPDGYVEPQVGFWRSLEQMAARTANMIRALPMSGIVVEQWRSTDLTQIQSKQVRFLTNFAAKTEQLREIAEQEMRQEPLNAVQLNFIDNLIQRGGTNYAHVRVYDGWYPALYYWNSVGHPNWDYEYPLNYGATKYDALVADVHTDVPDYIVGDPGGILHQGVGKVHLLFIAVDSGSRRTMYAGPVLSYYEFETSFPVRKTDIEWKQDIANGQAPPHPSWTRTFLVPSP